MGMLLLNSASDLNPRELFASGEQGLWLDPSDMNATKAGWRRNLLTYSEMFSHANWSKQNSLTVTANTDIGVDGLLTADTLTNTGVSNAAAYQTISMEAGTYTFRVWVKAGTATQVTLSAWRSGVGLFASTTVSGLTSEYQEVTLTINNSAAGSVLVYIYPNNSLATSGSIVVARAMLVAGSTVGEYQPITDFSTEFKAAFPTHTLYQDSNGVTPCTAAGDPVGLILDQSRGGLSQIGADLVTNGGFAADTNWTKGANWTIGSGVATKTGGAANDLTQTITSTAAAWYRISLDVTRSAGTLTISLGTSGTSYAITATGSYTFFILAGSGTQTLTLAGDSSFAGTVDNVVARNVPGNHAYQTTSAARPTLQTSGGLWYLSFDGSDDSLVTNTVDFSGTAQMTVIAGVRSLANTDQLIVEASANYNNNIGTFFLGRANPSLFSSGLNGNGVGINYGTVAGAASRTDVLGQLLDNSATTNAGENSLRLNAVDQSLTYVVATPNSNAGNFGNYQLFIGRRNQATIPYNGHLYQLIIRGKTTPTGKLLEAERFTARKTGLSI